MNNIVVFDLGKVLVDFDYSIAARKIAGRSTKKIPDLQHFLGSSEILERFESGLLTRRQFFEEIKNFTGFLGSESEFVADFADIFLPIEPMIELHSKLRRKKIPTYIFSNTNDIAIEHIQRNFPFFKNFDDYIFSHEVGAMKPEAKIYEALEAMTKKCGAEIIYIDDRPENIETGNSRDWKTILHESPEATLSALKTFGFEKFNF